MSRDLSILPFNVGNPAGGGISWPFRALLVLVEHVELEAVFGKRNFLAKGID